MLDTGSSRFTVSYQSAHRRITTHKVCKADPERRTDRYRREERLTSEIRRVWEENFQVYGARKVWRQQRREGIDVACCTVERLMHRLGIRGVVRGQPHFTTISDPAQQRAPVLVTRNVTETQPNQIWVANFIYAATWSGFVYVAFAIDVYARCIVG